MLLIEQNDEWLVQRRYLSDHSIRLVLTPPSRTGQARSNNNNITEEVATLNAGSDPNVLTTITSYTTKRDLTSTHRRRKRVFRTDRHDDRRVDKAAGLAAGESQDAPRGPGPAS
jgi:hypothetical protein